MLAITAGDKFTDIDAYASAVAYAELLNLTGKAARVVLEGPLNYSMPKELQPAGEIYEKKYAPIDGERFVLVDISDVDNAAKFVDIDRVEEVIDHHPGMEQFWREKIGERSDIELIGASATQIYERWVRSGNLHKISRNSARLLSAAILDNTLNFTAMATSERDHSAYDNLTEIANLPANWSEQYFTWCQRFVEQNLSEAIRADTKIMTLEGWAGKLVIGQLAVWDAVQLIDHRQEIQSTMEAFGRPWFINIISITHENNYLIADDGEVQDFIAGLLSVNFVNGIAQTDRPWLRKEIAQKAIESKGGEYR